MQGLAEYCFARENERVRAMFADCTTLAGLEERITGYLQDIAASRMGSYKMIAETLGMPRRTGAMPACMAELKEIVSELLARLQAAGGNRPGAWHGVLLYVAAFRRCRRPDGPVLCR